MSCELRPNELVVDARSLIPSLRGGCKGEEFEEARDRCDSLRIKLIPPGSAKDKALRASAAFGGNCFGGLPSVCRRCRAASEAPLEWSEVPFDAMALVDALGVGGPSLGGCCPGGGSLTGSGNKELRFLFLRGSLKNVVWVETVCVVVVVEP